MFRLVIYFVMNSIYLVFSFISYSVGCVIFSGVSIVVIILVGIMMVLMIGIISKFVRVLYCDMCLKCVVVKGVVVSFVVIEVRISMVVGFSKVGIWCWMFCYGCCDRISVIVVEKFIWKLVEVMFLGI